MQTFKGPHPAMDSSPKIAAIILQYGQWQKTLACVRSLLQGDLAPRWLIVVDNASPDDSGSQIADALKNLCDDYFPGKNEPLVLDSPKTDSFCDRMAAAHVILAMLKQNNGYAAGNNYGLRLGLDFGADAFLVLNNDTTVEPQAVGEMWQRLKACPRPGLCGALLVYAHGSEEVQCLGGGFTNYQTGLSTFSGAGQSPEEALRADQDEVEKGLNFICGACVMASRKFVTEIGLMDEGYFLYCEEQDWAIRAANRFDLAWAKNAIVHHHEGASTGWSRFNFNWRGAAMLARSRLRLTARHFPQYLPSVILGMIFAAGRLGVRKIGNGLFGKLKRDRKRISRNGT